MVAVRQQTNWCQLDSKSQHDYTKNRFNSGFLIVILTYNGYIWYKVMIKNSKLTTNILVMEKTIETFFQNSRVSFIDLGEIPCDLTEIFVSDSMMN